MFTKLDMYEYTIHFDLNGQLDFVSIKLDSNNDPTTSDIASELSQSGQWAYIEGLTFEVKQIKIEDSHLILDAKEERFANV